MTHAYRVSMMPNAASGTDALHPFSSVDVYETFETEAQAQERKREVLASVLTADDEDLTRIMREPCAGVTLRYFAPRLSVVREMSKAHDFAAVEMARRWAR